MNKHSVAIILPYFGKFPNYFPLWLKSAGANSSFTFMIFTDIDMSSYNIPPNVQVHAMTLDEIRQRTARHLDFKPVLDTPYKLCDYRTMFGLTFEDYLADYDFWGFCDSDIIFGDMDKYITDELLDKYDRLYHHGHLQFLRNTEASKSFVLHKLPYWNISYRDVYRTNRWIGFDEFTLSDHLFSNYGGEGQYYSPDFADLHVLYKEFKCWGIDSEVITAFRWKDGKIFALAVNGDPSRETEYLYVHLQKRAMKYTPGLENEDSFMIIPNEFVKDHELTTEEAHELMTPSHEYEQNQRDKYSEFLGKKRTIFERIIRFLKHDTGFKMICIKRRWNKLLGRKLPNMW